MEAVVKNLLIYDERAGRDRDDHTRVCPCWPTSSLRVPESPKAMLPTEGQAVNMAVNLWETFLTQTIMGVPRENTLEDRNYAASSQGTAECQEEVEDTLPCALLWPGISSTQNRERFLQWTVCCAHPSRHSRMVMIMGLSWFLIGLSRGAGFGGANRCA